MSASFGPQFALGFLHRMTQAWKDQYISWFIAASPVFSGRVNRESKGNVCRASLCGLLPQLSALELGTFLGLEDYISGASDGTPPNATDLELRLARGQAQSILSG